MQYKTILHHLHCHVSLVNYSSVLSNTHTNSLHTKSPQPLEMQTFTYIPNKFLKVSISSVGSSDLSLISSNSN